MRPKPLTKPDGQPPNPEISQASTGISRGEFGFLHIWSLRSKQSWSLGFRGAGSRDEVYIHFPRCHHMEGGIIVHVVRLEGHSGNTGVLNTWNLEPYRTKGLIIFIAFLFSYQA